METFSSEAYDQGWESKWDDMKRYGPFSCHIRRILKNMIRPLDVKSMLDVGCGQGSLLAELTLEFPYLKPYGIDISKTGIELAKKKVPDGEFWLIDVARDALNKQYDLVICSEVLEHIIDDTAAIRNLRQMTAKYLLISTPQGKMREFEKEVGHVRNYAAGELVGKLAKNGFSVTSVVEWGYPFYSPLYRDFLDVTGSRGTTGEFGHLRKVLSRLLYLVFMLNSSKRGDEIFVLAQPIIL